MLAYSLGVSDKAGDKLLPYDHRSNTGQGDALGLASVGRGYPAPP